MSRHLKKEILPKINSNDLSKEVASEVSILVGKKEG